MGDGQTIHSNESSQAKYSAETFTNDDIRKTEKFANEEIRRSVGKVRFQVIVTEHKQQSIKRSVISFVDNGIGHNSRGIMFEKTVRENEWSEPTNLH